MKTHANRVSRRSFVSASLATITLSSASLAAGSSVGRRGRTIDCQSHLYVPEMVKIMEQRRSEPVVYRKGEDRYVRMGDWHRKILPKHMDVAAKLADMDANGIEITAISINDPGPEWFGNDGVRVARIANDFVADLARKHPSRFIGLCVLPLHDLKAAMAELDRCVKGLGMRGILFYTNILGSFPDSPDFRPVFARAVDLDIPIFLHPVLPVTASIVKDYEMISGLGNMFDNTIALARLIMSGVFDQFPTLKLVCPHLGGTLPYVIGRLTIKCRCSSEARGTWQEPRATTFERCGSTSYRLSQVRSDLPTTSWDRNGSFSAAIILGLIPRRSSRA